MCRYILWNVTNSNKFLKSLNYKFTQEPPWNPNYWPWDWQSDVYANFACFENANASRTVSNIKDKISISSNSSQQISNSNTYQ